MAKNAKRTHCTDFARQCTPIRALFCLHMLITGYYCYVLIRKVFDFIDASGGRTRDRTLDLSRVKGNVLPCLAFARPKNRRRSAAYAAYDFVMSYTIDPKMELSGTRLGQVLCAPSFLGSMGGPSIRAMNGPRLSARDFHLGKSCKAELGRLPYITRAVVLLVATAAHDASISSVEPAGKVSTD
jgi:hypothetical protein